MPTCKGCGNTEDFQRNRGSRRCTRCGSYEVDY